MHTCSVVLQWDGSPLRLVVKNKSVVCTHYHHFVMYMYVVFIHRSLSVCCTLTPWTPHVWRMLAAILEMPLLWLTPLGVYAASRYTPWANTLPLETDLETSSKIKLSWLKLKPWLYKNQWCPQHTMYMYIIEEWCCGKHQGLYHINTNVHVIVYDYICQT